MRKLQVRAQEYKRGEVTAFLALIFILLVAFTGSLMESASLQSAKSYRRADANRAMECVFAEYQKDLLEEYDLFALDGSYETGSYSESNVMNRLDYYGCEGMEHNMQAIQLFTDQSGLAFRKQVSLYIESKYGLSGWNETSGTEDEWEAVDEEAEDDMDLDQQVAEGLDDLLETNEAELPVEDNPLSNINTLKNTPLIELVLPEGKNASDLSITLSDMVSHRSLRKGYGTFSDAESAGDLSKLALNEYIMKHFQGADQETVDGALAYELEYLIAGKGSDRENLEAVLQKLLLLRFVPNYAYLQTSAAKQEEARVLALSLCTLIAVPEVAELLTQALLLAWAFGESIMDLRVLMQGGKVPATKDDTTWQISLAGLRTLGSDGDHGGANDLGSGFNYEQYLRALLLLQSEETLSMRCMDLIEVGLQTKKGLTWFKMDDLVSRIEVKSKVSLRRGITYTFQTAFGYR